MIVVFGAGGDLARRKLLPSFFRLWSKGLMPSQWRLVATGRTARTDDEFRSIAATAIRAAVPDADVGAFLASVSYVATDFGSGRTGPLLDAVEAARATIGGQPPVLAYLSTPPSTYEEISRGLVESDVLASGKVVFEKPFGRSRHEAAALAQCLRAGLEDDQVFLIDHFLGKEAVHDLLSVRFANGLFQPVWNRDHIDRVEIEVLETGDVGSRGDFFEETGTIRDMLATHLFHVLSFAAMDPPASVSADAIAARLTDVLTDVHPLETSAVVRGQYDGYRDTPGVADDSDVETFAAARVEINNRRWSGVPFVLRTGKSLAQQRSRVTVVFKQPTHDLFESDPPGLESNHLTIDLNRPGCLKFGIVTRAPGWSMTVRSRTLGIEGGPDKEGVSAYERLLHDALVGDHTLFSNFAAVDRAWHIVEPVLREPPVLQIYARGSAGPDDPTR